MRGRPPLFHSSGGRYARRIGAVGLSVLLGGLVCAGRSRRGPGHACGFGPGTKCGDYYSRIIGNRAGGGSPCAGSGAGIEGHGPGFGPAGRSTYPFGGNTSGRPTASCGSGRNGVERGGLFQGAWWIFRAIVQRIAIPRCIVQNSALFRLRDLDHAKVPGPAGPGTEPPRRSRDRLRH